MPYFEIVKKHIDKADFMGFLEMGAPSDEYNIESKMIISKISAQSNANDIASIIAEVFYEMFGKRENARFYLPVAQSIYDDMLPPSYEKERETITDMLDKLNIGYFEMNREEITNFQDSWLREYAPEDGDLTEIEQYCFPLLWHLFSFDFSNNYLEFSPASEAFDCVDKKECVIYIITPCNRKIAFRLENANSLTSKRIESLNFYDTTITATDYSWTYSLTHENECKIGPYFAKKRGLQ